MQFRAYRHLFRAGLLRLRKSGYFAGVALLPAMLLLIALMVFSGGFFGAERTFILEVLTTGAAVDFEGESNAWDFSRAITCTPLAKPLRGGTVDADAMCDPREYNESLPAPVTIRWPNGSAAAVVMRSPDILEIRVVGVTPEYEQGSLILVRHKEWLASGALAFSGSLTVGGLMGSGEQGYLLSGRYEAREKALFSGASGRTTVVVKTGPLTRGDQVAIMTGESAAHGFGHLTPRNSSEAPGFHAVAISAPGQTALKINYFGAKEPVMIRPDWIDSAISSPFLLACTVILSLLAGAAQLFIMSTDLIFPRRGTETRDTESNEGEDLDAQAGRAGGAPRGSEADFETGA